MSGRTLLRDRLRRWVPWWLSDRHYSTGESVGFRFLWVIAATLDAFLDWMNQALLAPWPRKGTPTALPLIGRSRGILRGQGDTDTSYASKLRAWLDKWARAGSMFQLATEIQQYLANAPRVRIVNRAGFMLTVASDGTVTTAQAAWDWDSVTNPERASYWWDLWIIIYPTQWAVEGTWGNGDTWGMDQGGFGHAVSRVDSDAVRGLIDTWKSAHSHVRAVVWTSDATLFDPATPSSMPDGRWGQWGMRSGTAVVPSHRNTTSCRYWEM